MIFAAKPAPARWEGATVAVWIVLVDLLMIVWASRRPIDALQFLLYLVIVVSIPVLIHLVYRTWAAFTLEYWIDRNVITLRWARTQQVIPTQSIREIILDSARLVELADGERFSLFRWPMSFLDIAREPAPQSVNLCATRRLAECVVLRTDTGFYALSPADEQGFVEALQERYKLGATREIVPTRLQRTWIAGALEGDRRGAWLLATGLIGVLALFAVLTISFPNLPEVLAVRYNSRGVPEEIREKFVLFRLLVIGLLAWGVNAVGGLWLARRDQRVGAHMLWGGAILVQAFLLLALVSLIT